MSNKGSSVTGILGGAGGGGSPSFPLLAPDGTVGAPSYSFTNNSNSGIFNVGGTVQISVVGTARAIFSSSGLQLPNAGDRLTINDAVLTRVASAVFGLDTNVYFQNTNGEAALNANYTNATAAFSNTNLSITVISGRTYNFEVNLFISESTAADGWQIDFNGGTAAMTNFIANAVSFSETGAIVALANAVSAALATVINATTTGTTGGQWIKVNGSFVPSGNGTFIVRAAQNAHSTGTLTIKRGSNLITRDSRAV